jgi:aspartate aminotransferase-like enzyme
MNCCPSLSAGIVRETGFGGTWVSGLSISAQFGMRRRRSAVQVRAGLAARGIAGAIPPQQSSVVLRAYRLPPGLSYTKLHRALKAGGFVIYAGQGDLSKTLFRISTMGNLTPADIDRLLACFGRLPG